MSPLARIKALIFVSGEEGITLEALAYSLDMDQDLVRGHLQTIELSFREDSENPLELVKYNSAYQFVTKKEYASDLEAFAQAPHTKTLSRAAIETLAIVAYRQPITRLAVDHIRGVVSSNMLQRLQGRGLIKEVGRVDSPGRPLLYGTTDYFMSYFGLQTLEDLPEIEPLALNPQEADNELFDFKEWHPKLELEETDQRIEGAE
ncbi:SMC-Scp complex subunit ScpB [Hutsoniella sourekii]|uniref:SMC-Scp complex subunit ScpB n=1 Tax=Hutsoniella sourekii TaxID=87650 RepID=UPI0004806CB1|nr:SMC-Scp complex subunit ScpB [Hutsoniella sourekii]